jgi:hypothetical protein
MITSGLIDLNLKGLNKYVFLDMVDKKYQKEKARKTAKTT